MPAGTVLLDTEVDHVRCVLIAAGPPRATLTPREEEICRLIASGHPNKQIADILGISGWTVATHLKRIFGKLKVRSRAAMIAAVATHLHTQQAT
jgi:DNA-binding CsgD family transcriptional regulator